MEKVKELVAAYGDKILFGACAIILIGVFLPAISMSWGDATHRVSLFSGEISEGRHSQQIIGTLMPWVVILSIVGMAVVTFLQRPVKYVYMCVGICAGIVLSIIADIALLSSDAGRGVSYRWGFGLYLMVLGIALAIAYLTLKGDTTAPSVE